MLTVSQPSPPSNESPSWNEGSAVAVGGLKRSGAEAGSRPAVPVIVSVASVKEMKSDAELSNESFLIVRHAFNSSSHTSASGSSQDVGVKHGLPVERHKPSSQVSMPVQKNPSSHSASTAHSKSMQHESVISLHCADSPQAGTQGSPEEMQVPSEDSSQASTPLQNRPSSHSIWVLVHWFSVQESVVQKRLSSQSVSVRQSTH